MRPGLAKNSDKEYMRSLISVEEAKAIVAKNSIQPKVENRFLSAAFGCYLAEDIVAPVASPSYTNSSMDGYALAYSSLQGQDLAKPISLQLQGESCAGVPMQEVVQAGCCAAISTGGMLPEGTDSVVPFEHTELKGEQVVFLQEVQQHQFVRFEGAEFKAGEIILSKGVLLDPTRIAQLAAVGVANVAVFVPPRVSVILTGSELVPYDQVAQKHQVRDANGIMLETALRLAGGDFVKSFYVGDDLEATKSALLKAEQESDIIIFSGGVSVGPHDHVKNSAKQLGYEELFWRVSQKPGKPLFFARKGERLLFGLPGNPVSAYMNFIIYICPLLKKMCGGKGSLPEVEGELAHTLFNDEPRTQYFRVSLEQRDGKKPLVHIMKKLESYMISSVSKADGFITLNKMQTIEEGHNIAVQLLPWRN